MSLPRLYDTRETCKRGHDWETNKRSKCDKNGFESWNCDKCMRRVWDGDVALTCVVDNCSDFMRYRKTGWCQKHDARMRRHGSLNVTKRAEHKATKKDLNLYVDGGTCKHGHD